MPWRRYCSNGTVQWRISQPLAGRGRPSPGDAISELHRQGWRKVSELRAARSRLHTGLFASRLTASRETFSLRRRVFRRLFCVLLLHFSASLQRVARFPRGRCPLIGENCRDEWKSAGDVSTAPRPSLLPRSRLRSTRYRLGPWQTRTTVSSSVLPPMTTSQSPRGCWTDRPARGPTVLHCRAR